MFARMTSELISADVHDPTPFLVLAADLFLMMTLARTRSKMKRQVSVALGLIATGVATLVTLGAFPEYSLDPAHVLSHSMFSAVILLCGRLLVTQEVPAILDRFILLELKTFDRFQYALAQTMVSLASSTKRIHTGNLNLNMVFFLVGFIICLLFFLSFICL